MKSARRVFRNTGFLYGKMLITIIISLFSTRLILNALGAVDYGIFNLVGGIIAMLSFINSAMVLSTQRYMSFYLGTGHGPKLKTVFVSSVVLHLVIGISIVLLLEIAGLFLFNGVLNIPLERITNAKIIFHFMVVSTFFTINAVPYDATIISHENMLLDSILGIIESIMKLGIAIWLLYSEVDKLILFGLLTALLTIFIRIIKGIYCHRKYEECRVQLKSYFQIDLVKEMLSFAGWNFFGAFCAVLRNQGLAVVLNLVLGILVNAAYGIANQVAAYLSSFSANMLKSLFPQIVKSEGSGDRQRMLRLAVLASKLSFFLLAFFAIPLIIEMPFVLKIWLKIVPPHTVIFCQLILVVSLLQQLSVGMIAAVTSVGKIKAYQLTVGALLILNLPLGYALIKLGLPAYSVFVASIFLEIIAGGARIWFTHKIAGLVVKDYLIKTLLYSVLSISLAALVTTLVRFLLPDGFIRIILSTIASTISLILFGRYIAMTHNEIKRMKELILSFYINIRNNLRKIRNTN